MNLTNKFKTLVLSTTLFLAYYDSNAQMNINGTFNVVGEVGVFSNLQLGIDAQLFFQNGSTLNMMGTSTTINSGSEIFANTSSTQTGTGRFLFAGTVAQTIDGGNSSTIGGAQPSLINLAINNPNNLTLINTNTRITSGIDFTSGHILLGNNNLELSSTATAANANGTKHVVTNGTGFMAKEGFTSAFSFPVGRATSDFTPATITPTASDNFFVQVKNYSESASNEFATTDGVDRTWNIYSTSGTGANISLQHNSSTNGSAFSTSDAFVTQYEGIQWITGAQQNQGVWQVGTGANAASGTGSILGSTVRDRNYTTTAIGPLADAAFFSKSSNILTPLPIALLDFNANKLNETQALLSWSTTSEINSSHFEVETSSNGQTWRKIGEVKAHGVSYELTNYQLIQPNPSLGVNYYRLNLIDLDGSAEYSKIRSLLFGNVTSTLANVVVFPNPSNGMLNISSSNKTYNYTLTDMHGKTIHSFNNTSENSDFQVDLSSYANGVYFIKANSQNGEVKVFKIVLNK
jgi:hypothetical protein